MMSEIAIQMGAAAVSGFTSIMTGYGIGKYANSHFNAEDPTDQDQLKKAGRKKAAFNIIVSSLASAAISTGVGFAASAISDSFTDNSSDTSSSDGDASDTDTSELR